MGCGASKQVVDDDNKTDTKQSQFRSTQLDAKSKKVSPAPVNDVDTKAEQDVNVSTEIDDEQNDSYPNEVPSPDVHFTVVTVPDSPVETEEPLQSLFAPKQESVKQAEAESEQKEEDDDDFDINPPTGVRHSLIYTGGMPRNRYERLSISNGGRRSSCFKSFDSIAVSSCQPIVHELIDIHGDDRHWLEPSDAIRDFAVLYFDFQAERCGDTVANSKARAARTQQSMASIGTLTEVDEE